MQRTKTRLPDSINLSPTGDFTQVPNDLIRNPAISSKAKVVLIILLSNREGWTSYKSTLRLSMKEGINSVDQSLKELEELGYLMRIRYKDKNSKQFTGTLWAYTDIPNNFKPISFPGIEHYDLELPETQPQYGNHNMASMIWEPCYGNQPLIILNKNIKKEKNITKKENCDLLTQSNTNKLVDPVDETIPAFQLFWKLYPRKQRQFDTEKEWNILWTKTKPVYRRELWTKIRHALKDQKQSNQWQDPTLVPLAVNWLKGKRWLDENPAPVKHKADVVVEINEDNDVIITTYLLRVFKSVGRERLKWFKEELYGKAIQDTRLPVKEHRAVLLALLDLLQYCSDNQKPIAKNQPGIPSVDILIMDYLDWLSEQDWINDLTARAYSFPNVLFQKFYRQQCVACGFEIMDGEPYGS